MDEETQKAIRMLGERPTKADVVMICGKLKRRMSFIDLAAAIQQDPVVQDQIDDLDSLRARALRRRGWRRIRSYGLTCGNCEREGRLWTDSIHREIILCTTCLLGRYPNLTVPKRELPRYQKHQKSIDELVGWALEYPDPSEAWANCTSPEALITVLSQNDGLNSPRIKLAITRCLKLTLPYIQDDERRETLAKVLNQLDLYWSGKSRDLPGDPPTSDWHQLWEQLDLRHMSRSRTRSRRHIRMTDEGLSVAILDCVHDLYPFLDILPSGLCRTCSLSSHDVTGGAGLRSFCPYVLGCRCCQQTAATYGETDILGPPSQHLGTTTLELANLLTILQANTLEGKDVQETRDLRKAYRSHWIGVQDQYKVMSDVIRSVIPCPTVDRTFYTP